MKFKFRWTFIAWKKFKYIELKVDLFPFRCLFRVLGFFLAITFMDHILLNFHIIPHVSCFLLQ